MKTSMIIHPPSITEAADGTSTVSARVEFGSEAVDLWYKFHGVRPQASMDGFVAALLLAAMTRNFTIHCKSKVSKRFLSQISTIQDVYLKWAPKLHRIEIEAEAEVKEPSLGGKVASFFSGGVDSYHTLLTNLAEINFPVFIYGFDIPISHYNSALQIGAKLRSVVNEFGLPLIEVSTNLRTVLDQIQLLSERGNVSDKLTNFELAHGSALTSIGHLLPGEIDRIYIPATNTYNDLTAWGSHPLLDPLFSNENKAFFHFGCASTRVDKLRLIASSDVALRNLRVCPAYDKDRFNCGRCEKCLRTMVVLRLFGVLDKYPIFSEKLDVARLTWVSIASCEAFWLENLNEAEKIGTDYELIKALRAVNYPSLLRSLILSASKIIWKITKQIFPVQRKEGKFVISSKQVSS